MARAKQPKQIPQMTIPEWETAFPDEDACCAYLAGHRWPGRTRGGRQQAGALALNG